MATYTKFYLFVLRNNLYHYFFWFIYWLIIAYLVSPQGAYYSGLFPAFFVILLHSLVSYFNIYLLIPNLLYKQQYVYYITALFLSILLVCFPLAIIISSIFPENDFLAANIWTPFFFVANSLYILLTVSFTSFFHLFSEWYRKERANKELERINTQNELKYLKSQINPHFLFNSLNNLYAMTLTNSPNAPDMVLRLSSILRYLLYETSETKVPLDKEINYLKDLLELEKIRVGDRADISFEIIGDTSAVEIEPLLFINFVENSFKHGVNSVTDSAWMKMVLKVDKEKKTLDFTIENSKPVENLGDKNDSIGGIGLVNVKKRLRLLYPNKHKLSLLNDNEKYSVNLLLHIG